MTSRRDLVLHVFTVLLLSAYSLSLMLRANLGIVPISFIAIVIILGVHLILVAGVYVALRAVTSDVAARAAWLSVFLIVVGLYAAVTQQAMALGLPLRPDSPSVSVVYVALGAAIATFVGRPWQLRRRDPIPMLIVGLVLLGTNTVMGVSRLLPLESTGGHGRWRSAAADLIGEATRREVQRAAAPPDIYYIVLDGFGSVDTLARLYGVDLSEFSAELTTLGFQVVPAATSNYTQTYLSLASTLNLDYLDAVAQATGRSSSDRFPLAHLIDRNALMTLAKRAGYYVVGIGSDYAPTEVLSNVDRCLCAQHGSSSTVQALLAASPMLIHFLGPHVVDAHRRKILDAFAGLEQDLPTEQPLFVFAHILAPHPPFVFDPDGARPATEPSALFQDGSAYGGTRAEYRDGYRNQVQFLVRRLRAVINVLLRRSGPSPVIVLHGDHGPGIGLDWNSAERTDMTERTSIFAAYRLPDATRQPYSGMTPINGARLVSNEYLRTDFPQLEDKTYYSTWGRPYNFMPVSHTSPVVSGH